MHPLTKIVVATSILAQITMSPVMAAQNPGDSCSPDGSVAAFSGTSMTCRQSKWVLDGPMPQPEALGTQQPAASVSTVKKANNFRTVSTVLSDSTFGSTAKQVADASAVRLPNGRIKLFAFVNSMDTLPGTLSATSTSRTGRSFVADIRPPLPGIAAGQPRVISLGGKRMRLFYLANGNINVAISTDNGATFTVEGPVITTEQAGFEPGGITVIRHKGKWRAYFSNFEKPGERATRVMRTATSPDMLTWEMGPVITQGSGPLGDGGSHPFAVIDRGRIALYYAGDRGSFYGILVSTSRNGISFKGEKSVIQGGGDPDIVRLNKKSWIMYYGADLGGGEFGIKAAKSTRPVVPRK